MKITQTPRGFDITGFEDRYGKQCSLQKSSLASEDAIWFGCDKIGLQHFKAGEGWRDVLEPDEVNTIEEHYVANTRMHLTQDMVKELLPALKRFAKTGNLS